MKYAVSIAMLALLLSGCSEKESAGDDLKDYSYTMGYQTARTVRTEKIDLDLDAYIAGFKASFNGKEGRLSEEEMRQALMNASMRRMQAEQEAGKANSEAGQAYLKENGQRSEVTVTESGLQYEVLKEGTGKRPGPDDTVKVHYRGTLLDGTEFDSSFKRDAPVEFPVSGVIPGWQEGVQLMKVGSKFRFVIPSNLAYGNRRMGEIPPASVLVFEVELLEIL